MVHVRPDRGVSGEGVEAIEGASDGIHVGDQYDQSSNNFQLAGFLREFLGGGKVGGDFLFRKKKRVPVKFLLDWSNWSSTSISLFSTSLCC